MGLSFDKALGIHQMSLGIRAKRAEILASNIANANTPGFKARDIDFKTVMKQAKVVRGSMTTTHSNHLGNQTSPGMNLLYRANLQPDTGDGNTVDMQQEQSDFMANSLQYQMSLRFLEAKFDGLKKALKGS